MIQMKLISPVLFGSAAFFLFSQATDTHAQSIGTTPALVTLNASKKCGTIASGPHESYGLPANGKLPDGISFATDWSQIRTGGWFGAQIMDSCRTEPDGMVTWHGKAAVRVEVQSNDDPLNPKTNSDRAEMMMMQTPDGNVIKENAGRGIQYYATSYYFPTNWQGQQLPWYRFAPTDCSFGDQNQCNSWSVVWQFSGWGAALSAAQTDVGAPQRYLFNGQAFNDGGRIQVGKWTDFVFMVDWSTGAYNVWRRNEGQIGFTQVLSARAAVPADRDIYVKQGLYRGGNVSGRTDVLWIGPTARGLSFTAVEQQAFGTDNGHPDKFATSPP